MANEKIIRVVRLLILELRKRWILFAKKAVGKMSLKGLN